MYVVSNLYRLSFVAARRGDFPAVLCQISPYSHSPITAVIMQVQASNYENICINTINGNRSLDFYM